MTIQAWGWYISTTIGTVLSIVFILGIRREMLEDQHKHKKQNFKFAKNVLRIIKRAKRNK